MQSVIYIFSGAITIIIGVNMLSPIDWGNWRDIALFAAVMFIGLGFTLCGIFPVKEKKNGDEAK